MAKGGIFLLRDGPEQALQRLVEHVQAIRAHASTHMSLGTSLQPRLPDFKMTWPEAYAPPSPKCKDADYGSDDN